MPAPVCHGCGSADFRIAHLYVSDFGQLATMRYPLRCRQCRERTYVFMAALPFIRKKKKSALPICKSCGHSNFRVAHLRLTDLFRLMFLRCPLRCNICRERSYASLSAAMAFERKQAEETETVPDGATA